MDNYLGQKDNSSEVINCQSDISSKIFKNCCVKNCHLGKETTIGDFSRIYDSKFSEHVQIERFNLIKDSIINRYSYTGKNTVIQNSVIGAFCSISWNVTIGAGEHDYSKVTCHSFLYDSSFGLNPNNETGYNLWDGECVLGNDVWVAANACICRNVKIGNGAVIGAGAVVTHDVEPYTIIGGTPAKEIKKRFDDYTIRRLSYLRWWDLPSEVIAENFELFNSPPEKSLDKIETLCKHFL